MVLKEVLLRRSPWEGLVEGDGVGRGFGDVGDWVLGGGAVDIGNGNAIGRRWKAPRPNAVRNGADITGCHGLSSSISSKIFVKVGAGIGVGEDTLFLNQLKHKTAIFLHNIVGKSRCSACSMCNLPSVEIMRLQNAFKLSPKSWVLPKRTLHNISKRRICCLA